MARFCSKCQLPLAFKQLPSGKWCPTNPDGSDHWDLCRATRIAAMSPEERAARDAHDALLAMPIWTGTITYVYCGSIPPWDEALGPFRKFTGAEKRDRTITRKWAEGARP